MSAPVARMERGIVTIDAIVLQNTNTNGESI